MKKIKFMFIYLILSLLLFSCKNDCKFEKIGWSQKSDFSSYSNRESMLKDLTDNYKLKGITYPKLIDLLGLPEHYADEEINTMTYNIVTRYGNDIDPVYIKNLEIKLDKDSIAKEFKIIEIKH